MSEERWQRMLAHLGRARSKPTFDAAERAYRLEVAGRLRQGLELAREGSPWLESIEGVLTGSVGFRAYDLTERSHSRWLRSLAAHEGFGSVVGGFLDPELDPVGRFASFAQAAQDRLPVLQSPPELLVNPDPGWEAILSLGSLLNFASAPHDLPVVRPVVLNLLEQTLGYEWTFRLSLVEQYKRHLAFAGDVQRRLEGAGVEVQDMLDVQSLIQIAATEADFWAADPASESRPPGRSPSSTGSGLPKPYLSVCAIYRDETPYLEEWIEFHRLVGVERFFLYNNFSEDEHLEVLAPYLDEGIVTVHDWPVLAFGGGQIAAYNDCLRWHRYDARWIAFIDVDEFLFSRERQSLAEVLADYEAWPGLAVRWAMFGSSGHVTKPSGLVIENYLCRLVADGRINVKAIVDPTRVTACLSAHHFAYPYLSAVDENQFPVPGTSTSQSAARVGLNHYHWKSREEYLAKVERNSTAARPKEDATAEYFERLRRWEDKGVTDDAILTHVPALRKALAARAEARRPAAASQRS